jgi:hypothetical protein
VKHDERCIARRSGMVRGDIDTSLRALKFDRRDVLDMTALGFSLHIRRNMDPLSVFAKP